MAEFKFRLEGLLRLRQLEEDRKKEQLSLARARLESFRSEVTALDREYADGLDQLAQAGEGALDLAEIAAGRKYLTVLDRRKRMLLEQIETALDGLNQAQRALETAARERKVVERLRERQLALHREQELRAELREMDEIAVTRHGWSQR